MSILDYDWKKAAAQMAAGGYAEDVERAFMDLAYNYISQKAGPLLDDPHRLGFEVVYSNDDNTKMAGIFAFRIAKNLFSVPCFFITGDVKGTELLYEHNKKLFKPLTAEWTQHLVSRYSTEVAGQGQSEDMTSKMRPGMRLERLANPWMNKSAAEDIKVAWEDVFSEMEKNASGTKSAAPAPMLRDFLLYEDDAMEKLAHAIEISFPFAEAVVSLDEEVWAPTPTAEEAYTIKKASETILPDADLTLYTGEFELIKDASSEDKHLGYKRGWMLVDARKELDLKPVIANVEDCAAEVSEPGFYNVICSDGKERKAFVGFQMERDGCCSLDCAPRSGYTQSSQGLSKVVIFKDGNYYKDYVTRILGSPLEDKKQQWAFDEELKDKPSNGGNVAVNTRNGSVSAPFHVASTKKRSDGVLVINLTNGAVAYRNENSPVISYDRYLSKSESNVFNGDVKFLPVATEVCKYDSERHDAKECPHKLGGQEQLWQFFYDQGIDKVSLKGKDETGNKAVKIKLNDKDWDEVDDVETAAVKVAHSFLIPGAEVTAMMDLLSEKGSVEFLVDRVELVKRATNIRIVNTPEWQTDYDQDLNVPMENPQQFALQSETDQPVPPNRRLGDFYDPNPKDQGPESRFVSKDGKKAGFTDDMLLGSSPEELAQMAQQGGVANLIDPGVTGLLISTYDSASMIAKYIPKLEEGLDHFGRLIFLFYWKPSDFEKLYGSDDMTNIENNLVSQFKSFGDILLELIKRNSDIEGSAPL
jgi:hypothetical protein